MKVFYKSLKSVLGMYLGVAVSVASISNTFGQADVQIGTETATATDVPISSCWGYSYTQQIYLATELISNGISGSAEITALRFYYNAGATGNSTDWTVYLGNSSKTSFTSTTDWESLANLANVFSGTVTYPASGNWMEITFDTPFIWDGTSNLIVAVDENQPGFNCSISWRRSNLGTNRSIYYRNDSTNPDPASPPNATSRVNYVSNIQLVATPATLCSTPALTNILSGSGTDVCENDDIVLSLENGSTHYFLDGITYQWQQFDGTNWTDINGATESTYTINEITSSGDYQVIVGCSHTGDQTVLMPVSITVNTLPNVEVDINASVICPSSSATITASGADTYSWSPAIGLSATNTAVVDASPANPTVYTVTGTDIFGCTATAQTTVSPYASVSTKAVTNPAELCEPNVPLAITIDEVPEVTGGTWEYRFLDADGITEAQPWNSTNAYNFIPAEDSVYTFYYQLRNSACTEALDSVKFSVVVGFGSEGVAVTDYDCNNLGGSVSLINPFGQVAIEELYSNDFNVPADLSAFTLTGSGASNTDNRLVLTPSATSTNGYASLTVPGFVTGQNNSFTLSFDLTADLPVGTFGTGGADGMAYSFGDDATPTSNGTGHNGRGTKLRLSFDSADNSEQNSNTAGIYLVYGWTATNGFGPGNSQTLAYSNNISLWKGKTDTPVELSIKADGTADLYVDGVQVFQNVQMPADYLNADVSNWNHLFSAQTGGDGMRHAIDNINISSGTLLYGITQNAVNAPEDWQTAATFSDLSPGTYYVWAAKDETAACGKQIQTVVIENTNPVINLGADTTICEGETLTLDAGNPGASYVWSGTNEVGQTLEVSTAGTYTVYATAANGCFGVGNINVAVNDAPTASGIYRQGTYPNFTFTVLNANNADSYDWNFGDGTTLTDAPATVSHYYTSSESVTVTATLSNDCGSTQLSQAYGDLSIDENQLTGLEIFPNPTTDQFTVSLNGSVDASVSVVSTTGAKVMDNTSFSNAIIISTNQWERGIYFVTVTNNGQTVTNKVVIK